MGGCGLNAACQLHAIVTPWWTFIVWGFWIVVALVVLGVLAQLKQIGGWPAVIAAAGAALAAGGYLAGRRSVPVARPTGGTHRLTRSEIMALQRALAARHLYPGEIDGKLGAKSQAGVKALQRERREPVTGFPTYQLLRDLGVKVGS